MRARLEAVLLLCHGSLLGCQAQAGCVHEAVGLEAPSADDQAATNATGNENFTRLLDGRPLVSDIGLDKMKFYSYENLNVTTMNEPEGYRKIIVSLEPCEGVVYLFVRKTRRCWPSPRSCCRARTGGRTRSAPPCNTSSHTVDCEWTHFHSVIDGTRDGAPTFFEVPHGSTKYFLAVYAPEEVNLRTGVTRPTYRLTVLADVGAFPRPGARGRLKTQLAGDGGVEVSWDEALFIPSDVSGLRNYHLYSSLLLDSDVPENEAIFMSPSKVMNSVCGLEMNAVRYGTPITSASCFEGTCRAIISGIVPRRRYMLNVMAESYRGLRSTYSGIIVSADWADKRHAFSDWSEKTTSLVGAICGTVFGVLVMGYLWIAKLYK